MYEKIKTSGLFPKKSEIAHIYNTTHNFSNRDSDLALKILIILLKSRDERAGLTNE